MSPKLISLWSQNKPENNLIYDHLTLRRPIGRIRPEAIYDLKAFHNNKNQFVNFELTCFSLGSFLTSLYIIFLLGEFFFLFESFSDWSQKSKAGARVKLR